MICSRLTSNHSMMSSIVAPASRFSKTVATGMRVPRNTQAPLTFSGELSTAGHRDQSSADMSPPCASYTVLRCAKSTDGRRKIYPNGKKKKTPSEGAGRNLVVADFAKMRSELRDSTIGHYC